MRTAGIARTCTRRDPPAFAPVILLDTAAGSFRGPLPGYHNSNQHQHSKRRDDGGRMCLKAQGVTECHDTRTSRCYRSILSIIGYTVPFTRDAKPPVVIG